MSVEREKIIEILKSLKLNYKRHHPKEEEEHNGYFTTLNNTQQRFEKEHVTERVAAIVKEDITPEKKLIELKKLFK
jgi:hypothetical protein